MLTAQFTYSRFVADGAYRSDPGFKVGAVLPGTDAVSVAGIEGAVRAAAGTANREHVIPDVEGERTAEVLRRLPRTLKLLPLGGGGVVLANIVNAGIGADNRGAQAFVHGLLVEPGRAHAEAVWTPELRPIDLLGGSGWLIPAGAAEIESVQLGAAPQPAPIGTASASIRADFVAQRRAELPGILRGFEAAVTGRGLTLVIADESPITSSYWIAVLSHLLIPSAAWGLPFSSFEIIHEDHVAVVDPLAVVGTTAEGLELLHGARRGRIVTAQSGAERAETGAHPWSDLVLAVWEHRDAIEEALDRLGRTLGASVREVPLWGVPAAVLSFADATDRFGVEVLRDAAALVLEHWPVAVAGERFARAEVVDALERWAPRDPDALSAVLARWDSSGFPPGSITAQVAELIRVRAIAARLSPGHPGDLAELTGAGSRLGPASRERVRDRLLAADGWIAWAADESASRVDAAHGVVRALTVMESLHLDEDDEAVAAVLVPLLSRRVIPLLLDTDPDSAAVDPGQWPRLTGAFWSESALEHLDGALLAAAARHSELRRPLFTPGAVAWLASTLIDGTRRPAGARREQLEPGRLGSAAIDEIYAVLLAGQRGSDSAESLRVPEDFESCLRGFRALLRRLSSPPTQLVPAFDTAFAGHTDATVSQTTMIYRTVADVFGPSVSKAALAAHIRGRAERARSRASTAARPSTGRSPRLVPIHVDRWSEEAEAQFQGFQLELDRIRDGGARGLDRAVAVPIVLSALSAPGCVMLADWPGRRHFDRARRELVLPLLDYLAADDVPALLGSAPGERKALAANLLVRAMLLPEDGKLRTVDVDPARRWLMKNELDRGKQVRTAINLLAEGWNELDFRDWIDAYVTPAVEAVVRTVRDSESKMSQMNPFGRLPAWRNDTLDRAQTFGRG